MTFHQQGIRRFLVTGALLMAAAVTMTAQRGGYSSNTRSYTGNVKYDGKFVFVRMSYPWNGRGAPYWSHDYPMGEEHFMKILTSITNVSGHVEESSIMSFSDPEMFKFPVIYLCEPGFWYLSDAEVVALRTYLQKGGYMIVDDFRAQHWGNFDLQMSRVFPEGQWFDIPAAHPVFHTFFEIDDPTNIRQYYDPGRPIFRGMAENNDPNRRLMVFANYNSDISEYWEWSDQGYRPIDENNEAFKIGVNEFVYGITH